MATIRQEVTMLAASGLAVETCPVNSTLTSNGIIQLDTTQYTGPTYYFEVLSRNTSATTDATIKLRRKGTSTDDATLTIPKNTSNFTLFRSTAFTPPAGQTEYVAFLTSTPSNTLPMKACRIIVIQSGNIANTETQILLGPGYGVSTSSTTFVAGARPGYWLYTGGNWNGTITAYWEIVLDSGSTKVTATAELQVADGTGDGFVGWAAVGSDITSSAGTQTRTRSAAITLTSGRNYRIVIKTSNSKSSILAYNSAIIIDQGSSPTLLEPQYVLTNDKLVAGTGLQTTLINWDSTEWSGVTNTYKAAFDAADNSTSVAELDTAAGTQITGSSVNSPDNQGISGALTMPANGNLDCTATTNNNDVYSARILVLCNISTLTIGDWFPLIQQPLFEPLGVVSY